jgi:hypothetical protein
MTKCQGFLGQLWSASQTVNPAGGLASIECYHYGEMGHVKQRCPKWEGIALPKRGNAPASEEKNARARMASAHLQSAGEGQWIVDTGDTNHICNDLRLMSNVIVYDEAKPLVLLPVMGRQCARHREMCA